jgi:hypothetical protein
MRRYMTTVCVVGVVGAGAAAALAATPAAHSSLSGSGRNYQNHNGTWVRHGNAHFDLTTSGKFYYGVKKYSVYVKRIAGNYNTSCNGTHRVRATWIKVKSNGTWSFAFTDHGAHVRIWGTFSARNRTSVNYVVNFSGSSTDPHGLNASCASWVRGSARS